MNNEIHWTKVGTHKIILVKVILVISTFTKQKAVWHGGWNAHGNRLKVTIIVWGPTTQKEMTWRNLHRLLRLKAFIMSHTTNPANAWGTRVRDKSWCLINRPRVENKRWLFTRLLWCENWRMIFFFLVGPSSSFIDIINHGSLSLKLRTRKIFLVQAMGATRSF